MEQQLEKAPQQTETLETYKRLYSMAWDRAFRETMFLMAEQYSRELLMELNGQQAASPIMQFWKESLSRLSPSQMREGLRVYMASERGSFKPNPEDIIANAPDTAIDRPRKRKNPNCPDCRGTGYRMIQVKSTIHEDRMTNRVIQCDCVYVEYQGQQYRDQSRQLVAAPPDPVKVQQIENRIEQVTKGKGFPKSKELDLDKNRNVLAQQAEHLKRKHAK